MFANNDLGKRDDSNIKSVDKILVALQTLETELKASDRGKKEYAKQKDVIIPVGGGSDENTKIVEKLKKDVDVLKKQEAEAAEQVQKSVEIAETLSQQKNELELETGHLRSQVLFCHLKKRDILTIVLPNLVLGRAAASEDQNPDRPASGQDRGGESHH